MRLSNQLGQETLQAIFTVAFILVPVLFSTLEIGNVLHLWIGQHAAAAGGARVAGEMGEDDGEVGDRARSSNDAARTEHPLCHPPDAALVNGDVACRRRGLAPGRAPAPAMGG